MLGERLDDLIKRTVRALTAASIPYAVTGGIAMILSGRERATRDLDLVVRADRSQLEGFKTAARDEGFAHLDRADRHALEGVMLYRFWLPVGNTGLSMALDVQQGLTDFHESVVSRAHSVNLGDLELQVASVEDLILLKALAYRPIDRADAIELARTHIDKLDHAYVVSWAERTATTDRINEVLAEATSGDN